MTVKQPYLTTDVTGLVLTYYVEIYIYIHVYTVYTLETALSLKYEREVGREEEREGERERETYINISMHAAYIVMQSESVCKISPGVCLGPPLCSHS